MSVGVTKDYKLKVRNLHASHTLGWFTLFGEEVRLFFFSELGLHLHSLPRPLSSVVDVIGRVLPIESCNHDGGQVAGKMGL
jgi:hypothetical protein